MPVTLVKAGESAFVTAEDPAEVARLVPSARIEVVPAAGHSVQSDQPVVLRSVQ
jgi:esterase